jgi:ElaB/YqjD/DUF883 family membrane-anchored ribosome-binding protein
MEDEMDSKQTSGSTAFPARSGTSPQQPETASKDLRGRAGDAVSKINDAAQAAGQQAGATATSLASEANEKAKGVLNQQITAGAEWVGFVAEASKAAADHLDRTAPKLSGLVRETAQKVERFSKDMKDQTVEELYQSASDFTRRQPALVFGSAALLGFFFFRLLKTGPRSASATARQGGASFGDSHR